VQEKTIMKIGEWKTRSVFDRYNTVDEKGLADLLSNLIAKRSSESCGTLTPKSSGKDESSSLN